MAARGLLQTVSHREKPSSSEVLLGPNTCVRQCETPYQAVQKSPDKSANKTTGLENTQENSTRKECFQSGSRKDTLLFGYKHHWRKTVINPLTGLSDTDQRQGLGTRQKTHDAKAALMSTFAWGWPTCVAGVIVLAVTSVWVFLKWREHTLRNRGVNLVHIPHFPLQIFSPFGKYKGIFINTGMLSSIVKSHRFSVRKEDIFVVSYPRSGTTWTQELVYLIANDADCEKACSTNLEKRFPYLEDFDSTIEDLDSASSPRFIKSHLPYRLLPDEVDTKKPKVIYVMRNPKDVVVSLYHLWLKLRGGYFGNFSDFSDLFLEDNMIFAPWTDHVEEFWNRRHHDNILFITYEDLIANLTREVRIISDFLGKSLTDGQIESIVDHCSFKNMKKNPKVNYNWWDDRGLTANIGNSFIRKGSVGDWKNFFTPELNVRMSEKVDQAIDKMGIDVKYELE